MGAWQMVTTLWQDYSMKVPEYAVCISHPMACISNQSGRATVAKFLKEMEPRAVELRKA
jgi:hypothetical protein